MNCSVATVSRMLVAELMKQVSNPIQTAEENRDRILEPGLVSF